MQGKFFVYEVAGHRDVGVLRVLGPGYGHGQISLHQLLAISMHLFGVRRGNLEVDSFVKIALLQNCEILGCLQY